MARKESAAARALMDWGTLVIQSVTYLIVLCAILVAMAMVGHWAWTIICEAIQYAATIRWQGW